MLTFIPLFLFLFIVILVQFVANSKMNIGNQWLLLVLTAIFSWGVMVFLRSHLPAPVTISNWLPASTNIGEITFALDINSWTISFALISLFTGMVLAETIHLHEQTNIRDWSRVALLLSLGVICSIVDSFLAFVLSWTLFDVIELSILAAGQKEKGVDPKIPTILLMHSLGTVMVVAVMVLNHYRGDLANLSGLLPVDYSLLILGAGLRMTFYDEKDPQVRSGRLEEILGLIRRLLAALLAMVFLSRIPKPEIVSDVLALILMFSIFLVLFSSFHWAVTKKPDKELSAWITAFCGLSLVAAIRGQSSSLVAMALIMVLIGGWTWLYSFRFGRLIPVLAIVGLALFGFPYSPSQPVFISLSTGPLSGFNPFLWLGVVFLIAGIIRKSLSPALPGQVREGWMKLFYLLGVLLTVIALWIPGLWQVTEGNNSQLLLVSFVILLLEAILLVFLYVPRVKEVVKESIPFDIGSGIRSYEKAAESGSISRRLFNVVDILYEITRRLVNGFNSILEGEGGILWAVVFLALLMSLLKSSLGS